MRYRELLGTAQTIVEMNDEIQEVETKLSNISRRCNPRLVEKKLDVAVMDEGSHTTTKHGIGYIFAFSV